MCLVLYSFLSPASLFPVRHVKSIAADPHVSQHSFSDVLTYLCPEELSYASRLQREDIALLWSAPIIEGSAVGVRAWVTPAATRECSRDE